MTVPTVQQILAMSAEEIQKAWSASLDERRAEILGSLYPGGSVVTHQGVTYRRNASGGLEVERGVVCEYCGAPADLMQRSGRKIGTWEPRCYTHKGMA